MIDRATLSAEDAHALDSSRDVSAKRRDRNLAAGLCINENNRGTHGLATDGVRCKRCALVHKHGVRKAREMFEWHHAKPVYPVQARIE